MISDDNIDKNNAGCRSGLDKLEFPDQLQVKMSSFNKTKQNRNLK